MSLPKIFLIILKNCLYKYQKYLELGLEHGFVDVCVCVCVLTLTDLQIFMLTHFISFIFIFLFFGLFFFVFLVPHPRHMEVPGLGVQSEL